MRKFLFLYYGHWEPTPEAMSAWQNWFASVGDSLVDSGSPLGAGREVTHTGTREITPDMAPAVGYSIVNAENMQAAEKLLEGCPIITSVRVYEAMSM